MTTPQQIQPKLSKTLDISNSIYLKREDLHSYGSHKGRSIPRMIAAHHADGWNNFVISSSGNAALAAIHTVRDWNAKHLDEQITLTVHIGKRIDPKKKERLQASIVKSQELIVIKQVERPKQTAFQEDKAGTAVNLRQSTDDIALDGYAELAKELAEIENLDAVFVPTSSGTTALGLARAFEKMKIHSQIHIVQTGACHPIANAFDARKTNESTSLAGAIVDNIAHRKTTVINAIKQSGGSGWIVTNEEIENAMRLVKEKTNIEISPNSALAVAGLTRALEKGWRADGPIALLITGA